MIRIPAPRTDASQMSITGTRRRAVGVRHVTWHAAGRPAHCLLAYDDEASEHWQRLADVLVCRAHPVPDHDSAQTVLAAALRRLPGCLVATCTLAGTAHSERERMAALCRDGRTVLRAESGPDLEQWSVLVHARVVASFLPADQR